MLILRTRFATISGADRFHRLNRIREELRGFPAPLLDRHAVEALFGVGQRRARQVMRDLPAVRIGNALAVERSALLAKLEGVARSPDCERERERKQRPAAHLDPVRTHLAARNVRVPASADPPSRSLHGLPPAIELKPGELRIRFRNAEDLAAHLYELSQAMAHDWQSFQEAVE